MSYSGKKLHHTLDDVLLWADLRLEQGANIAPIMKRLRKELKEIRRELHRAKPGGKMRKAQPDGLDAIRALRPEGPRKLWAKLNVRGLRDRLEGAWIGRAAGCTLGAPVEGWRIEDMEQLARRHGMAFPPEDYWAGHPSPEVVRYGKSAVRDYLKGHIRAVPVDDDVTYTLLGLLILEAYGPDFTTDQVGEAWLKYLPMACTAEHVALENLKAGIPASKAGAKNNPFQHWIGADIRSDPWGYAAPGWPEKAAEMAYRDAYLSHRQTGIYGAMFFSAAIAAAFAVDDPVEALHIGLTEIPADCPLADAVCWALDTAPGLKDWREAREKVDERFPGMPPVHTINNACLTIFGLALGGKDFTKTIGTTVALGLDNDCTAATAGSILGAVIGANALPTHWHKPFRNRTRTYLEGQEWFTNTDVAARFLKAAKQVWKE